MKLLLVLLGLGLSQIITSSTFAAAEASITYKNQRGSVLRLNWHNTNQDTGMLTGTFTTAVGNCTKDIGVALPLTGYFNGNAVAVTVNFPHCKQVVAMTGNISDRQKEIYTLWLDAAQSTDPRGNNWNSNIIGSDTFKRIEL